MLNDILYSEDKQKQKKILGRKGKHLWNKEKLTKSKIERKQL